MKKILKIKNNKGYTLLFAVLVSSIVLSVGISILTISKKEFLLSSSARESTSAIYAADSGIECSVYWDGSMGDEMATTSTVDSPKHIMCGNMAGAYLSIPIAYESISDLTGNKYQAVYSFPVGDNGACAKVTVIKDYAPVVLVPSQPPVYIQRTQIESRGYNIGWNANNNCEGTSPKKVERALRLNY